MKINFIQKVLGSFFFTGYITRASGTFASLLAMLIYLIPGFENPTIMLFFISLFTIIGISLGSKFEVVYGIDPKQCTIDEAVGTWISLMFLPKKIWFLIPVFIVWRLLDIVKPFPAKQVEKIHGGWGIMLDDIISALYTFLLAQLVLNLIN